MLDRQFFQCGHDEVVGFPEGEAVGEVDGVGRLDDVVPRFLDEEVLHFLGERTLVSFPCLAKLPHQFHGSCGEGVAGGFVGDTHRKIREVAVVGARVLRIEESPLAHEHVDLQVHLLADRNILRQKIACCDPSPDPARHRRGLENALGNRIPHVAPLPQIRSKESRDIRTEKHVPVNEPRIRQTFLRFLHLRKHLIKRHHRFRALHDTISLGQTKIRSYGL